jgi:hypothetical protein
MADKKKVAFGGYQINFAGQDVSMEEVMGDKPLSPAEMTKALWSWVKSKKLASK